MTPLESTVGVLLDCLKLLEAEEDPEPEARENTVDEIRQCFGAHPEIGEILERFSSVEADEDS